MSRESRIKLLPSRTITPSKDQTASRLGRSIRMIGWKPGRADQPEFAGNTEIVDRKRSVVGDLDRPFGLVESQAERGKECWLTRSGDTADLDPGALDPCGNRSQRPFRKVFPQCLLGVGGRDRCRRVNVHGLDLDRDGHRPLHWLHTHWRDRVGRLLWGGDWSKSSPRNLIGQPVRGLARVALRLIRGER